MQIIDWFPSLAVAGTSFSRSVVGLEAQPLSGDGPLDDDDGRSQLGPGTRWMVSASSDRFSVISAETLGQFPNIFLFFFTPDLVDDPYGNRG